MTLIVKTHLMRLLLEIEVESKHLGRFGPGDRPRWQTSLLVPHRAKIVSTHIIH